MTDLLISAAFNIGTGILINALFPPPDIENEGPRLTELGFTSAAYGKFVNVVFGTDRIDGNIIETTDPAIEEIVSSSSSGGGGLLGKGGAIGGGQKVNTTTYTYFFTGRISWCIEGADDLIRWWADGKIIYDTTGTTPLSKEGVNFTFYPGGPAQVQDPEEVTRRGSDIPAYRHLTTLKIDRLPLADFGNRIPNFTAEISFNSSGNNPILNMVEPAGFAPPFTNSTYMSLNPNRNELYSLSTTNGAVISASDLVYKTELQNPAAGFGNIDPCVGLDGFFYRQKDLGSSEPLVKIDIESGEQVGQTGASTASPLAP